jgi:hypothetical protein
MVRKCGKSEAQARVRWAGLIKRWRGSGQTMLGWCGEQGVSYTQFCKWRRRLEAEREATPLTLIPVVSTPSPRALVVQLPGAVGIEVESGFDPALLAAVVRALLAATASC